MRFLHLLPARPPEYGGVPVDLEVRHLQLVTAVAAVGGLTKAGRHLHLTPSALSHQLRDVESRLGTPLFLRVGKRMVPTAAGERLVRSAQEILEALAGVEKAIQLLAGGERGRLRVIVAGYTSYHWLPAVVKQYRAIRPNVEVQIPESAASEIIAALLCGAVDVAIGAGQIDDKRLHIQPIVGDEVVFAVAKGHRMARTAFAAPADLGEETLYVDATADGGIYRQMVAAAGKPSGNVAIAETTATIELVKAGLGVALVGRSVIEPHVRAGTLRAVRITRKGVWCCWQAAMVKELAVSGYVRDFVDVVARELSREGVKSGEGRRS
jgi:LysR family transcriptional regulator, regulator for metE and metH